MIAQNLDIWNPISFRLRGCHTQAGSYGQTWANHAKVKKVWFGTPTSHLTVNCNQEIKDFWNWLGLKALGCKTFRNQHPFQAYPLYTTLQAHWDGPEVHWWRAVTAATCGKHEMARKVSQHVLNWVGRVPNVSSWKFGYVTMLDSGNITVELCADIRSLVTAPGSIKDFWGFCETVGKHWKTFKRFPSVQDCSNYWMSKPTSTFQPSSWEIALYDLLCYQCFGFGLGID